MSLLNSPFETLKEIEADSHGAVKCRFIEQLSSLWWSIKSIKFLLFSFISQSFRKTMIQINILSENYNLVLQAVLKKVSGCLSLGSGTVYRECRARRREKEVLIRTSCQFLFLDMLVKRHHNGSLAAGRMWRCSNCSHLLL